MRVVNQHLPSLHNGLQPQLEDLQGAVLEGTLLLKCDFCPYFFFDEREDSFVFTFPKR